MKFPVHFLCMPNPRVAQVTRLLYRPSQHTQATQFVDDMVRRVATPPVVTTSVASFKPQHTAKTKQAWRYAGGNILRAPGLMINGKRYEDPKDPGQPRRKHESNFLLTINSNKAPAQGEEFDLVVKQMEYMLKRLSEEKSVAAYLKFGPVSPEYRNDKYYDVVQNIDWTANVETGDKMHRVHGHAWLTVTHYSQVQINKEVMQHLVKTYYNESLPLGSKLRIGDKPYIDIKLLPQSDWTTIMKQYIHKGMLAS